MERVGLFGERIVVLREADGVPDLHEVLVVGEIVPPARLIEDKDAGGMAQHPAKVVQKRLLHGTLLIEPKPPLHVCVGPVGEDDKLRPGRKELCWARCLRGLDVEKVGPCQMKLLPMGQDSLCKGRPQGVLRVGKVRLRLTDIEDGKRAAKDHNLFPASHFLLPGRDADELDPP